MSTESRDTTHAIGADDRSDDVPQGGFAPIVDLPESSSVATMPPRPPVASGVWSAATVDADIEEGSHESSGHAPPAAFPAPPVGLSEPLEQVDASASTEAAVDPVDQPPVWTPPGAAVEQPAAVPAGEPASRGSSDDGVVFFGDGGAPTPPTGWVTDDDADLILPIEPARLVSAPRFVAQEPVATAPDPEPEPESPVADVVDNVNEADEPPPPPFDVEAVCSLFASRLARALGATIQSAERFLTDDDATEIALPSSTGPIVCSAGSELRGVVDDDSDLFGVSLEIGAPHNVSLGVRFPVQLVRHDGTASVDDVGGLIVIAVSGGLEATTRFDDGIDADVVAALTRVAKRFFDEVDRRREDAGVMVTNLSVDSVGAIRVEVDRD